MLRRAARTLTVIVVLLAGIAAAQSGSVEFELGMHGAVVDNAWNPLRVVLRDLPPVDFELRIDQGTLRSGNIPLLYSASIDTRGGITVFEDEIFVPDWSSLSWTVRSGERTVASGTLDPRLRDDTPLTLLVSNAPGRWLTSLPQGSRAQEAAPSALPERAAAYSGVRALIIDGTAPAPRLESVVAAAAAGAIVVLVEPLPQSHAALQGLASGTERLGAGWLVATGADGVRPALEELASFPLERSANLLLAAVESAQAPPVSRLAIVIAAALYGVVVLVLLRFGGDAGIPAALVVAAMFAGASWSLLRPQRAVIENPRTLVVSAGGLGLALPTVSLQSLPGGEVRVNRQMRLAGTLPYDVGSSATRLTLARWQREMLLGRPSLATGEFEWEGERLVNRGQRTLRDVIVVGVGPQAELPPGGASYVDLAEERELPGGYRELLSLLPQGAAIANDGERYFVALPGGLGRSL